MAVDVAAAEPSAALARTELRLRVVVSSSAAAPATGVFVVLLLVTPGRRAAAGDERRACAEHWTAGALAAIMVRAGRTRGCRR